MRRETASESYYLGERAIVVGGGLGGLSAARALSDRFRQVVILDRDELPDDATPRPGVPQGKHPHGLLGGRLKSTRAALSRLRQRAASGWSSAGQSEFRSTSPFWIPAHPPSSSGVIVLSLSSSGAI